MNRYKDAIHFDSDFFFILDHSIAEILVNVIVAIQFLVVTILVES